MNPHFFAAPFLLIHSYFIYCTLLHFIVLYDNLP